jgi:hypothetical protein
MAEAAEAAGITNDKIYGKRGRARAHHDLMDKRKDASFIGHTYHATFLYIYGHICIDFWYHAMQRPSQSPKYYQKMKIM